LQAAADKAKAPAVQVFSEKDSVDKIRKSLKDATGLWYSYYRDDIGGNAVLSRSGVVGANGEGTILVAGDLLPGAIVSIRDLDDKDMPLDKQMKGAGRVLGGGWVGYQIAPEAALLVKGRALSAVGEGAVTAYLPPTDALPARHITIKGKAQEDLTALRRAARDRAESFPPKTPEPPVVEKGTLVIVGGGGQPDGLFKKFVAYAGGEGKANIVIFPTASDPIPKRDAVAAAFKKAGAKKATVLYGKTLTEVESKEFLDTLKEATGLWFDGGRQWRFVDCYENTKALPFMFDVLKRGGVIGGSSAGATIQGDYLCRGGVFDNFDIRYEGYERGLGFLKGVAIDQHFSQRKRQADMTSLMNIYPQYLGIGIDEATAIVVKGQIADVMGKGKVHFYDAKRKVEKGEPDYQALSAGERYDLKERKVLPTEK
jgi:cyanophycinase